MKHFPTTPFATALSGSAKETELRIRSIFQWKKQRPPLWLMALVALVILTCCGLVSCQPAEPPPPQVSTDPLFIQPHGDGEFYVMEELPGEGQEPLSDTVAALYYRSPTHGEYKLATLDYGPGHHYWASVSLEPFTDVLGYDGVIFRYPSGSAWNSVDYYALSDYIPFLLAPCYNKVWQEDLDGDGQMELLSNYHTMGYLDVYQRMDNGLVTCVQLNSTAWRVLHNVPADTWVTLSQGEQAGTLRGEWRDESGTFQTKSLEGWALLMNAGVSTVVNTTTEAFGSELYQELTAHTSSMQGMPSLVYMDGETGQETGSFSWSIGSEPYTLSACWHPIHGQPQELFSLSYPAAPSIATGETEYTPLPQIALGAFSGVLGQYGTLFTYDKGGRNVHHFFYVDDENQAKPLALCDPSWTSKDLDGDGLEELWSISENGQFFYFYHLDPTAEGAQPRFAFLCGLSGNAPEAFRNFHRVEQTPADSFVFYNLQDEQTASMTGPELLAYIDEADGWLDAIPTWSDGGRVGNLD